MKITIKDGGREESRVLKLVSLGLFKNATEATEAAINALYEDALACELAQSAEAQAAESRGLDLAALQSLTAGPNAADHDYNKDAMPSAPRLSAQGR
jgi:hypothetical protein